MSDELAKKFVNFVASDEPLNADLGQVRGSGMAMKSAGHTKHEWTPSSCREILFNDYFMRFFREVVKQT